MSRPSFAAGALAALALLGAAPAAAQPAGGAVEIPHETYTLENGLKVILVHDPATPVAAVNVWYNVGSRNERPGRTGFAHLFEHMMFEGSANVGKGEHMKLVQRAGSSNFNGTTSEDRTNYYQVVPPARVNLALWLEADRMRSLNVSAENLANQQEVVKEEKRLRVDNAPYFGSILRALHTATYNPETCFAYAHFPIGSMEDLDAAQLEDVQSFFRMYYAPNNATLTVAGDFDPAQVRAMIREYFGGIPRGQEPPPVECTAPFSHLPTTDTVVDANANLPAYVAGWGAVPFGHPDSYALDLLGTILGGGESSRLHQRLVKEEAAANTAVAGAILRRDPGIFIAYTIANQGVTPERLQQLVEEELEKVRTEGVTPQELRRAQAQQRAGAIRGLQTALGKSEALQQYNLFLGNPALVSESLDRYMAVTREDLQRVARTYLVPANRAAILTVPEKS